MSNHHAEPSPEQDHDAGPSPQLPGTAASNSSHAHPTNLDHGGRSPTRSPLDAYGLLFPNIKPTTYPAVPPPCAIDKQNVIICEYLETIVRELFLGKVGKDATAVRQILQTHFSAIVSVDVALWEPFKETREAYMQRIQQFWDENEDFHGQLDNLEAKIDEGGKTAHVFINWTARGVGIMEEDRRSRRESVMRVDFELHDGRWVGHGWSFLLGPGHSSFVGGLADIPRGWT